MVIGGSYGESWTPTDWPATLDRLRQVDVKAEHFERQVARVEAERDAWEKKFEEAQEKYNVSKRELEEVRSLGLASRWKLPPPAAAAGRGRCANAFPTSLGRPADGVDLGSGEPSQLLGRSRWLGRGGNGRRFWIPFFLSLSSSMCAVIEGTLRGTFIFLFPRPGFSKAVAT